MKRSGQVKPSNSISASRRTALLAPSVPIRYRAAQRFGFAGRVGHGHVDMVGVLRRARSPWWRSAPRRSRSPRCAAARRAPACTAPTAARTGTGTSPFSRLMSNTANSSPVVRSRKWNSGADMPPRWLFRKRVLLQAEFDQHLDRRRMHGGGALVFGGVRQLLDQRDRDALLHQRERHDGADRPGPGHDHAIVVLHRHLRSISSRIIDRARVT